MRLARDSRYRAGSAGGDGCGDRREAGGEGTEAFDRVQYQVEGKLLSGAGGVSIPGLEIETGGTRHPGECCGFPPFPQEEAERMGHGDFVEIGAE